MYIENLNSPSDLKKLTIEECIELSYEIRSTLLKKISTVGGHLGSNLGIIEATIAVHYVFNSPVDKIVFDVSHQCYTHKILTGRKESYLDPSSYSKYNGYTNPKESEHDFFRVGHTATSLSLASGLAIERDLSGRKENIITIIGDGSLSGGEAMEGLNFAGSEVTGNFIVIFNDNQMAIAENHGGLYDNLAQLRRTEGKAENNIFRAFGYDYKFVKDGNDLPSLIETLNEVKDIDHPIVIHICTKKGNGYSFAEDNPERCHWVRPFNIESGEELRPFNGERYDMVIRDFLLEKMESDPKVVTILAAVPDALAFSGDYRAKGKRQVIDVGIAEEHAVSMAAGIARAGGKPVFATMSTFFQRCYDQISQELCVNELAITMVVVNGSVYAVNDMTHIGIFDLSIMSNIPNLVCLSPTNKEEYLAMLNWSIDQNKYPVAIRAPRNGIFHAKEPVDTDYSSINMFKISTLGEKIAIIALGDFYQLGEELAASIYQQTGINPTLVNPRFASGIDTEMLSELICSHNIFVTLEDGILEGGFGQKVSGFLGKANVKVLNYGLKKEFLDRYSVDAVLKANRLTVPQIIEDILSVSQ